MLASETPLDSAWLITLSGVSSIRMLHNRLMVFNKNDWDNAKLTNTNNPNLTDGEQYSLFIAYMRDVYAEFLTTLDLKILEPVAGETSSLLLTGYPQGLLSWKVQGSVNSLKNISFWKEYGLVLKGFLDFYRIFFNSVSRKFGCTQNTYFATEIERILLFNNCFLSATKKACDKCIVYW